MQIIIRPVHNPRHEIDLTHRLVAAIAEELWRLYGGNGELNWMEAERHLARIVGLTRAEAAETEVLLAPAETVWHNADIPPALGEETAPRRQRVPRRGCARPVGKAAMSRAARPCRKHAPVAAAR